MTSRFLILLAGITSLAFDQGGHAQENQLLRLSEALYFDCEISSPDDPRNIISFDVSYLSYSKNPSKPQINFIDSTRMVFKTTGWAPNGSFALARLTSDGQLFVWAGTQRADGFPDMDVSIELIPNAESPHQASLAMRHFTAVQSGSISAKVFQGDCEVLNGEAAYYRFSKGDDK